LKLPPPFCGTQDAGTKVVNAILFIVANHFLLLSWPRDCGPWVLTSNTAVSGAVFLLKNFGRLSNT
jgi:hypothetical protein